jgi:D-alanine-D-alanine ligase
MKIAVLLGGLSSERDVSISGGLAVINALRNKGHFVVAVDPAFGKDVEKGQLLIENPEALPPTEEILKYPPKNFIDCIQSDIFDEVDCVFLVLHGKHGEDGKIQSLLELRGVPFTGSGSLASALTMDKELSKSVMRQMGILVPPGLAVTAEESDDYDFLEQIRKEIGSHIVVKPNDQGSTIGISIIKGGNLDDLSAAIKKASEYSELVVVEKYIPGYEIAVGIVGDDILPPIEIIPESGFYDFEHKYTKGKTRYECPADFTEDILQPMMDAAERIHFGLGCSGFSRVDFRLTEEGRAFCLEINTIPGFTELSLVPMGAKEIGLEFAELCEKIIDLAIEEHKESK